MKAISCYQQAATFTSLSQGPAAWEQLLQLNLSATGYWMEWPELPKIKMLRKCAVRNGFCLLTADGFKGCWGPLCFRFTPAVIRLQQSFGKVCVLDGMDLYEPENIFLTHNWTIKSDTTVNVVKRSKSRRKHGDVVRAQISLVLQKKKLEQGFPALFLEGCSGQRGAGWVLLSKAICSATPFLSAGVKEESFPGLTWRLQHPVAAPHEPVASYAIYPW